MVSIVKEHTVWWEVQVSKLYDIARYMGGCRKRSRGTPNADNLSGHREMAEYRGRFRRRGA